MSLSSPDRSVKCSRESIIVRPTVPGVKFTPYVEHRMTLPAGQARKLLKRVDRIRVEWNRQLVLLSLEAALETIKPRSRVSLTYFPADETCGLSGVTIHSVAA